jgi:hypothetical protein
MVDRICPHRARVQSMSIAPPLALGTMPRASTVFSIDTFQFTHEDHVLKVDGKLLKFSAHVAGKGLTLRVCYMGGIITTSVDPIPWQRDQYKYRRPIGVCRRGWGSSQGVLPASYLSAGSHIRLPVERQCTFYIAIQIRVKAPDSLENWL